MPTVELTRLGHEPYGASYGSLWGLMGNTKWITQVIKHDLVGNLEPKGLDYDGTWSLRGQSEYFSSWFLWQSCPKVPKEEGMRC